MTGAPKEGTPLTERERGVLAWCAQGLTYSQAGRRMDATKDAAEMAARRAAHKLGAASITQAIHLAVLRGEIGWYPDCGDRSTYLRHLRRGEPPDLKCRRANAAVAADQRRRETWAAREERRKAARKSRSSGGNLRTTERGQS